MSAPARAAATATSFDANASPRRLNLGCGWDHREGFVNVDLHPVHSPDLVADVRQLGFLPARHYQEVVAQDVLEHLPRTSTLQVLQHWNRLLEAGGILRLRVPNLIALADLFKLPEYRKPEKQMEVLQFLFGTQAYTGDFHYTSFTDVLLRHFLQESGFKVRRIEPFSYWLYDVEAEKVRHIEGPEVFEMRELVEIPGDETFVATCYQRILRREPDEGGREGYLADLRSGAITRYAVVQSFLDSEEYRSRHRAP